MRAAIPWLVVFCAAAGCGDGSDADIQYSSNDKPLGKWPAPASTSEQMQPVKVGDDDDDPAESPSPTVEMSEPDAGADDTQEEPAITGSKPPLSAKDAGAAAAPRLTFSVLTQVQHMRLNKTDPGFDDDARGPKNMGAIWISKRDGTFVRSLEVWRLHKERARHLVAYNKACECPKPDVTATATLNKHKPHTTRWDMTDRDGAQAPEGPYTLHIEVADYDVDKPERLDTMAMNAQWSVDFDTHDAPKTLMPESTPYYTNLKLELLAP